LRLVVDLDAGHNMELRYSRLTNTVTILIDGHLAKKDRFRVAIPAKREYDLELGSDQPDKVHVVMTISRFVPKLQNPEFIVTTSNGVVYPPLPA
jgi:hypothetical protein